MPYDAFTFSSGGFTRDVQHVQGGKPDAVVVLHGSDTNGAAILDSLANRDANVSYYALNALQWTTGSGTKRRWIQPWKVGQPGFPSGANGDTDLVALRDLVALLKASHGAARVVLLGFSGGGYMTLYTYSQGADYNAFGPCSATPHTSQVVAGALVVATVKPCMWLVANGDPTIPTTDHLTSPDTRLALQVTHGCSGYTLPNDGTTCGKTLKLGTYTGYTVLLRPYSVIDTLHKWYSCSATKANEALFVKLCRDSGALA